LYRCEAVFRRAHRSLLVHPAAIARVCFCEDDEPFAASSDTGPAQNVTGFALSVAIHRRSSDPARTAAVRLLASTMTDADLAEALKRREPGASELLYERYGPYVERLVVRAMGLDPEVPDLINEVFARALEGVRGLRQSSALKGWIGSVALFTARRFLRSRRTRRRWVSAFSLDEVPETAATVASPEVSQTLVRTYAVLDALPADERIAFALRFVDGMELHEVAQVTRVSLATVKRRLVRAQQIFWDRARQDPILREHAPLSGEGEPT
jgi:RNA polymerase sigma-70 factor (ECF subfamily)